MGIYKKLKIIVGTVVFAFAAMVPLSGGAASAASLFDNAKTEACKGAQLSDTGTCAGGGDKISSTLSNVVNLLSVILGIIAVIMLIVAGIKFVTSQGDGNSTASARNTIIYAVIGLVVALLAQAIVQFVLEKA